VVNGSIYTRSISDHFGINMPREYDDDDDNDEPFSLPLFFFFLFLYFALLG